MVAAVNVAVWAVLIPAFHVPDETNHFAYAQHLAETGSPPRPVAEPERSDELQAALAGLQFDGVIGNRDAKPLWTAEQDRSLERALHGQLRRDDGGGFSTAVNNPPLYYGLQALPYAARGGTLLDRLLAMRLVGALLAAVTTLGVFAFVRELLPSQPWAAAVGALVAGLQPTFAFIAAGVNNDGLLFATAAWLFFLLARAFRHGLTVPLAAALGATVAAGLLAKATLLGLAPGLVFGALMLLRRVARERGWGAAVRPGLVVAGLPVLALAAYAALSATVWDRPLWSAGAEPAAAVSDTSNVRELVGYAWQFYLPRLPFMDDQFDGFYPLWDVWFQGFVGRFGWLDYAFPPWVYTLAGIVLGWVLVLSLVGLVRSRHALRRRAAELATYALMTAGLLASIALAGYDYRENTGFIFEQARYLVPLLALYGAVVAVALRGAGRFAPAVGVLLVLLALAHSLFAQLLTLSRYYA